MSVAFLFPGQGSQQINMLHTLPKHPQVTQTLEQASTALGENVLSFDNEEKLISTVAVQICLLTAGVASARTLIDEGSEPDMVAGHSVGAFGAAVIANVLSFEEAIKLVKLRGTLMEEAYPTGYGMGVVMGLEERKLNQIIDEHFSYEAPVFIANLNSRDQITVSGTIIGIEKVLSSARERGAYRAELLNVSVPSHCELLQSVSIELDKELQKITLRKPTIPYAGNKRARALFDPMDIRKDLALSISHSVKWYEVTSLYYEMGVRLFIEMPPGSVLTKIAANTFSDVRSISIDDSGINTARILVDRMKSRYS